MASDELKVETQLRVARPADEVFEAIVDPERMAGYFISSGSGRLDAGEPVTWRWADVGAELEVAPHEVIAPRQVEFRWAATGAETRVVLVLHADVDAATVVRVTEAAWPRDAQGTARCLQQMQGWVHFLCCLKARLEHGIDLRAGGVVK